MCCVLCRRDHSPSLSEPVQLELRCRRDRRDVFLPRFWVNNPTCPFHRSDSIWLCLNVFENIIVNIVDWHGRQATELFIVDWVYLIIHRYRENKYIVQLKRGSLCNIFKQTIWIIWSDILCGGWSLHLYYAVTTRLSSEVFDKLKLAFEESLWDLGYLYLI